MINKDGGPRVAPGPAGRRTRINRMDPTVLAFTLVVLAALAFGVVTAPLGLLLGLPPVLVVAGVFLGSAAFVLISVPVVVDAVPDRMARQVRRAMVHGPRIARWWGRARGDRAALLLDRGSALIDRLGYRGIAVLAPVLGRWLVPAAGVAFAPPRRDLYRWAVLGCATWAAVFTFGTDLLRQLVLAG